MHLVDMIFFWARAAPNCPAIIQPDLITTYQGLADAIESISSRIDRLNLNRREPVAVSILNPSFMLATVYALMRSGYDVAPVNSRLYPHLHAAGIRNLIYDTQGQVRQGGRNIRFDASWLPTASREAAKYKRQALSTEAVDTIFFTSGTTGVPKKIVQTGTALETLLGYPFTCASGIYQKILVMPGLASSFGFNRSCEILNAGKTMCFAPGTEDVLSLVGLFGVELIVASAMQSLSLAEAKTRKPGYQLDSLKSVLVGGGKIAPERIASLRATLCKNLVAQYGSTECGVVAMAPFDMIAEVPGAVGFVLPWVEVEVVDEDEQAVSTGAEGAIRYRTPQLTENLKAEAAEVSGVKGEWFYPGDTGSLTTEGILCVSGRTSDVINRGGIKVSATRIEEILQSEMGLKEAAACAVAGSSGLEEIWVAVVSGSSIDVEDVKQRLAVHSDIGIAPDQVFVMDELPRGELGKVQKYRLKELMLVRKRDA